MINFYGWWCIHTWVTFETTFWGNLLRQPYGACQPVAKHCERIKKCKEVGDLKYIYRNELGKACFVHCAACVDIKDFVKRTNSNSVLKDKSYETAVYPE